MAHSKFKIGDVFSVSLDEGTQKYFQYVADDPTQLNSEIIRAFRKTYPLHHRLDTNAIVLDEIDFFAHVSLMLGIRLKRWIKVGTVPSIGEETVLFRISGDYGNPKVRISQDWYVWRTGEPLLHVGRLKEEYQKAEIGVVVSPDGIVHRMRTGEYDFVYPEY